MFENPVSYQKPEKNIHKEYLSKNPFGQAEIVEYFESVKNDLPEEFFEKSFEEIIQSKKGWERIAEDFLENNYPEEFSSEELPYGMNPEADECDIDEFEDFKGILIPRMFRYNPEKAREFFGDYLINLYKTRRKEWIGMRMWADHSAYEPDDYEKDEQNQQDYVKNISKNNYEGELKESRMEFDRDLEMEETHEIFGKITSNILEQFAKFGERKDFTKIISYIENDFYARYHLREISEYFKKIGQDFSCNFLGTALGGDAMINGSIEKSKIFITLLLELEPVEEVRKRINEQINNIDSGLGGYAQKKFINPQLKESLATLRSLITPNHDKIAISNLQKFYQEKIKFEDYKVNQEMNAGEVKLLQKLISKDNPRSSGARKVLEEGCGTGRLMLEMEKAGYDITGFDFTGRHTEIIKEKNPEANVLQGDWHQTGFKEESFDAVYSLGRNILHDYSIVDQVQLFREAARILKPGGRFIFDIPNREKGGYKMLVEEYKNEMEKRGIKNFRYGTIYDSPDGEYFATRYAYSEDDIKMLAQLAGFKIVETRREELATGKGDENLYFVLEKK